MRCIRLRRLAAFAAAFALAAAACPAALAVSAAPGETVRLEIPFTQAAFVGGSASVSNGAVLCDVSVSSSGAYYGSAGGAALSVTYGHDVDGTVVVSARVRDDAPAGESCTLSFIGSVKAEEFDARMLSGELVVTVPAPKPAGSPTAKPVPPKPADPAPPPPPPQDAAETPVEPLPLTAQGVPAQPSEDAPPSEAAASGELASPSEPAPDEPEQPDEPEDAASQPDVPDPPEDADPDGMPTNAGPNLAAPFLIGIVGAALAAGAAAGAVFGIKRRREERETDYMPLVEYDISEDA